MANELVFNLESIANVLPVLVEQMLNDAAYVVENHAKDNCPVDTGVLRASITHTDPENNSVTIGTNIEYAVAVEEGHGSYPPQKFLSRAFTENIQEIRNCFDGMLEEGLN